MLPRRSLDRLFIAAGLVAASGGWIAGAGADARDTMQVVQGPNGQQVIVLPGPAGQRGQPTPTTGTAFIAGQVVEQPSGLGVPNASVLLLIQLGARGSVHQLVADSQGRFFVADLPAGSYRPQAAKAGYASASPTAVFRPVELADGERITDLKIKLVKLGSLAGTIRDDGGDPVVGTIVRAFRRSLVNGRGTLVQVSTFGDNKTDDRGAYRLTNLTPGDYFVCACSRDPIPFDGLLLTTLAADPLQLLGVAARALTAGADVASLDSTLRTFAPTFFPNSPTVAQARRVTLASGEDKTGVDVDVAAVLTRVSGAILGATGAVTASSLWLTPAGESEEGRAIVTLAPMLVQPDGRFDFVGVPPGQYVLHVIHQVNDGRGAGPSGAALAFLGARGNTMGSLGFSAGPGQISFLWAVQSISVPDDGLTDLSIALRPAMNISGRAEFVGSAPPPVQTAGKPAVILSPLDPNGIARFGVLNPDATFRVPGLLPGRYTFNSAVGFPGWPTMKSVTVAGADVLDLAFELGAADISDVVLSFGETPLAALSGTVPGGQTPASDTTVLIFPTDRRYWADPDASRRRYFSVAVSRNGSFTQAGLPAGEYFVVAVPDDAASEWQEASKLETLSRGAQRVQVADGDKKTIEVKR